MTKSLLVAFTLMVHSVRITNAETTETVARSRMFLISYAAKSFQVDNCSAPASLRELTLPVNYLLSVSQQVYPTVWIDPFSSGAEPFIIETELIGNCSLFDMPTPDNWRIRSRGPDGKSNSCEPQSQLDDIVMTHAEIDDNKVKDAYDKHLKILESNFASTSPLLLRSLEELKMRQTK